jgi:lipopolysaccharide biosynthesis protein
MKDIKNENSQEIEKLKKLIEIEEDHHKKTKIKLMARERELHDITQSNSYKLARILAKSKHSLKVIKNHVSDLTPKRRILIKGNQRHVRHAYQSQQFNAAFERQQTSKIAVVLHLYYTDMLPYFIEKFKNISHIEYDLFITIPEDKSEIFSKTQSLLPDARIAIVPNCGRDVLPFVEVIRKIQYKGYTKVLKLHSKKSPHRHDGAVWRDKIVKSLLPSNKTLTDELLKRLSSKKTALIGPSGEYLSLLVNFSATAHYVKNLVGKIVATKAADDLTRTADEYGFFAGTMFWARMDALAPIVNNIHAVDFEPELGQEDSTLAHALERLFNVIPELNGKDMFEITNSAVCKVDYHTTNIPSWSEVAIDN